jgi:hypothetical protein
MGTGLHCATGAILALLVAGCGSVSDTGTRPASSSQLSHHELAKARSVVHDKAESEGAQITSGTVTAEAGTVPQPNTGYRCSSGRLLRITLIGSFPHTGVAPIPADPSHAAQPSDSDVHAMLLTADAATGRVCEIGVQTGAVSPDPNATVLDLG